MIGRRRWVTLTFRNSLKNSSNTQRNRYLDDFGFGSLAIPLGRGEDRILQYHQPVVGRGEHLLLGQVPKGAAAETRRGGFESFRAQYLADDMLRTIQLLLRAPTRLP